jgi:hypothetical protein
MLLSNLCSIFSLAPPPLKGLAWQLMQDQSIERRREGTGPGGPSGLQKRSRRKLALVDSPLLDRIRLVFLAFTDLDGLITFRLD